MREERRSFREEITTVVAGPVSCANDWDDDKDEEEEEKKGEEEEEDDGCLFGADPILGLPVLPAIIRGTVYVKVPATTPKPGFGACLVAQ